MSLARYVFSTANFRTYLEKIREASLLIRTIEPAFLAATQAFGVSTQNRQQLDSLLNHLDELRAFSWNEDLMGGSLNERGRVIPRNSAERRYTLGKIRALRALIHRVRPEVSFTPGYLRENARSDRPYGILFGSAFMTASINNIVTATWNLISESEIEVRHQISFLFARVANPIFAQHHLPNLPLSATEEESSPYALQVYYNDQRRLEFHLNRYALSASAQTHESQSNPVVRIDWTHITFSASEVDAQMSLGPSVIKPRIVLGAYSDVGYAEPLPHPFSNIQLTRDYFQMTRPAVSLRPATYSYINSICLDLLTDQQFLEAAGLGIN